MQINPDPGAKEALYDKLPEDVKAVLALMPPNWVLDVGYAKCDNSGYLDIWIESERGEYFFTQDYRCVNSNIRRFVTWVRAGMPEGYTTQNPWENEE